MIRGGLLQIVTFGFYRFWLLTDIRRHLWSGTSVDGDAFEYTGRGRELLHGFLFAMAILVARCSSSISCIGLEAERYRGFRQVLPLLLVLFFFFQFRDLSGRAATWLTRTVWRGVRLSGLTGSG